MGIIYSLPGDRLPLNSGLSVSLAHCHPSWDRWSCVALTLSGACVGICSLRCLHGLVLHLVSRRREQREDG